jgi:hypothetical protein
MKMLWVVAAYALVLTGPMMVEAADETNWNEILTDTEIKLPAPRPKVEWLTRFDPAFKQAQEENRPLFVTFRCLPCKQCAEFDQDVLNGGTDLDPLLKQFVTLRSTATMDYW